jgi:hypothetical protein
MRCLKLLLIVPMLLGLVGCGTATPVVEQAAPSVVSPPTAVAQAPTAMPTVAPTAAPSPTALPTAVPSPTVAPSPTPAEPTAMPPGWTQIVLTGDQPPARYDHSALFDPVRGQLLVFGGRGDGPLGDTWAFDMVAQTWREMAGPGPEPRFGHGAVYDAATRRMIVVMGQGSNGFFNDAWAFDLDQETWVQLKSNDTGNGPRPRYGQSAALDGGARVLISHGFSDQGRFDDTWAFADTGAGRQAAQALPARAELRCRAQPADPVWRLLFGLWAVPAGRHVGLRSLQPGLGRAKACR